MKQDGRRKIVLGAATLALSPWVIKAHSAQKISRIGFLSNARKPPPGSDFGSRWLQTLGKLGWVEGQNVVFESRYSEGKTDLLPELARELVQANVDVIATFGGRETDAARQVTSLIPIVMVYGGVDPVQEGLIKSFARPGGNITGISRMLAVTDAKRLELIKEMQPLATRLGVLANARPEVRQAKFEKRMGAAAGNLGVELQFFYYKNQGDVEAAFPAMASGRVQAFVLEPHWFTFRNRAKITELALRHRLAGAFTLSQYAQAGGLLSYGPSWLRLEEQHAGYIDRILRGANPAELPIEQPTKFDLVINVKTARALGITVPQSLLLRATTLIE